MWGRAWVGFKNNPTNWITAAATVFLAAFALAAWIEAIHARNIAQRQLVAGAAAFVFMEKADIVPNTSLPNVVWAFIPRWRNSGETPTDHLIIHVNQAVFPGPMPNGYYLTDFPASAVPIVLGPKATIETGFLDLDANALKQRPHYFWGWAKYRDTIEGKSHISRFCYILEGWQGNPDTPVAESAAPLLLSVAKQVHPEAPKGGQPPTPHPTPMTATLLNLLPFKPIFVLCNEGNCRDEECTEQAAKYSRKE